MKEKIADINYLSELDQKELDLWACNYGHCGGTATHRWDLVGGDYVLVCSLHCDREFMLSILNQTDHIPTFQDLLLRGFSQEKNKKKEREISHFDVIFGREEKE